MGGTYIRVDAWVLNQVPVEHLLHVESRTLHASELFSKTHQHPEIQLRFDTALPLTVVSVIGFVRVTPESARLGPIFFDLSLVTSTLVKNMIGLSWALSLVHRFQVFSAVRLGLKVQMRRPAFPVFFSTLLLNRWSKILIDMSLRELLFIGSSCTGQVVLIVTIAYVGVSWLVEPLALRDSHLPVVLHVLHNSFLLEVIYHTTNVDSIFNTKAWSASLNKRSLASWSPGRWLTVVVARGRVCSLGERVARVETGGGLLHWIPEFPQHFIIFYFSR